MGILKGNLQWIKGQRYELSTFKNIHSTNSKEGGYRKSHESSTADINSSVNREDGSNGIKKINISNRSDTSVSGVLFRKVPKTEREEDAAAVNKTDIYPPVLRLQRIFIRAGLGVN